MTQPLSPTSTRASALIAWLWIPAALYCLVFILSRSTPVPYWDQFAVGQFLLRTYTADFPSFADLFAQHNESRKFFPRLLFWLLTLPGEWNVRREMLAHWALLVVGAVTLTALARRSLPPYPAAFASVLAGTLLFSIAQWQNLLWGIQIITSIPTVALLLAVFVLQLSRPHLYLRAAFATFAALVATYSYANGMALWPLMVPLILLAPASTPRQRVIALTAFLVAAFLAIAAYFWTYARPGAHPALDVATHLPSAALKYFIVFIGNGLRLADGTKTAELVGYVAVGVVLLVSTVLYGFAYARRSWDPIRTAAPWLTLAAYTMLSSAVTTVGRLGFGVETAASERYVTFALPLFIAVVPLTYLAVRELLTPRPEWKHLPGYFATFLAGALIALQLLSTRRALAESGVFRDERDRGLVLATWIDVTPNGPEIIKYLFPDPNFARDTLRDLNRLHKLPFAFASSPLASTYAPPNQAKGIGSVDTLSRSERTVTISGWAVAPGNPGRSADAIFAAAELPGGDARLLAMTINSHLARPDVPQFSGPRHTGHAGWAITFDLPPELPPDANLAVFAYHAPTHSLHRLSIPPPPVPPVPPAMP